VIFSPEEPDHERIPGAVRTLCAISYLHFFFPHLSCESGRCTPFVLKLPQPLPDKAARSPDIWQSARLPQSQRPSNTEAITTFLPKILRWRVQILFLNIVGMQEQMVTPSTSPRRVKFTPAFHTLSKILKSLANFLRFCNSSPA
jgi:hypothetical protein